MISLTNRFNRQIRPHLALLGRVRFHPLFLALLMLSIPAGLFQDTLVLFILVMLHEIGHAAVANQLGYEVQEVSLLPFGGVAKLAYGDMGFNPRDEAMVAIAGPFMNLLLTLLAWLAFHAGIWSVEFFHLVAQLNIWIAVFNLLPGLPLDGGRILRAARARAVGYEIATREAYRVSLIIAVILLVIGGAALWAGHPHAGMIILGIFLFVSSWTGRRDTRMETIRFLDAKRQKKTRQPQIVRALVAPRTATLRDLVIQFAPDRYHMIYVLADNGEVTSVIEENEIIDAVFEGGWLESVEQLAHRK